MTRSPMESWPVEAREAMQRISDEARPHNITALRRVAAHVRSVGGRDAHGNSDQQYDRAADQLTMVEIQRATLALRTRTGDASLGVHVRKGKFQVVSVVYGKGGRSTATPKSGWLDLNAVLAFMGSYA